MIHHHNIVSHSDDDTDHNTEKSWYCCSAKLGNSWAEQPPDHTPGEYLEVDETVMRQSWDIEFSTVPALHPKSISLPFISVYWCDWPEFKPKCLKVSKLHQGRNCACFKGLGSQEILSPETWKVQLCNPAPRKQLASECRSEDCFWVALYENLVPHDVPLMFPLKHGGSNINGH